MGDVADLTDAEREQRIREIDVELERVRAELGVIRQQLQAREDAEQSLFREYEHNGRTPLLVVAQFRARSEFPNVRQGWNDDILAWALEQSAKMIDAGVPYYVADALTVLDVVKRFKLNPRCGNCANYVQMRAGACRAFNRITEPDTDALKCPEYQRSATETTT